MNKDTNIIMNLRRLRNLRRCNTFPTIQDENVAAHSYFVTTLCCCIGDELNSKKAIRVVNMEVLLKKALFHDAEEAYTSDIPWNVKHYNNQLHDMLETMVNERLLDIFGDSNVMKPYMRIIKQCKDDFEGKIVGFADTLELALYCYEESKLGNTQIYGLGRKCVEILNSYDQELRNLDSVKGLLSLVECTFDTDCYINSYIDTN